MSRSTDLVIELDKAKQALETVGLAPTHVRMNLKTFTALKGEIETSFHIQIGNFQTMVNAMIHGLEILIDQDMPKNTIDVSCRVQLGR